MRRHLAKIAQCIDTACKNWWRIGLFLLMAGAAVSMVILVVWLTGVGIHSDHIDVNPAGHVRSK